MLSGTSFEVEGRHATGSAMVPISAASHRAAWYGDLGWAVSSRGRVGLSVTASGWESRPSWSFQPAQFSAAPYGEWVVAGEGTSDFELAVAAGPHVYTRRATLFRDAAPALLTIDPTLGTEPMYVAARGSGIGAFGRVSGELRLHPQAALTAQAGYRWTPPMEVEEHVSQFDYAGSSRILYLWDAFTVRTSALDLFVGTRWSF